MLKDTKVQLIYSWHPNDPKSKTEIPPHDKSTRGHTSVMVDLSKTGAAAAQMSSASRFGFNIFMAVLFVVAASVLNLSSTS
jgi:hypothetical protein